MCHQMCVGEYWKVFLLKPCGFDKNDYLKKPNTVYFEQLKFSISSLRGWGIHFFSMVFPWDTKACGNFNKWMLLSLSLCLIIIIHPLQYLDYNWGYQ